MDNDALYEIKIRSWEQLTPQQVGLLQTMSGGDKLEFEGEKTHEGGTTTKGVVWGKDCLIVSSIGMAELSLAKIDFETERVISGRCIEDLSAVAQRQTTVMNNACHVAVSGLGLLAIKHVRLELDCCTDYLKEALAEGWRILAICVQPDQRRPDYILGRSDNKEG